MILDEAQAFQEVFPRIRGAIDAERRRNGRFLLLGSISPVLMRSVGKSPARPQATQRLMRIVAALNGQQWNASELGRSMGLSSQTVASYLDYLEDVFLLRRLPPFHANLSKRLVKAPRVQWRDTGLLHASLGILDARALRSHPAVGASWESFVVEQALGTLSAVGLPHDATYFRTRDGHEIDLVIESGRHRIAIEIKLATDPSPHDLAWLDRCARLIRATRTMLVSQVPPTAGDARRMSCGVERMPEELGRLGRGP